MTSFGPYQKVALQELYAKGALGACELQGLDLSLRDFPLLNIYDGKLHQIRFISDDAPGALGLTRCELKRCTLSGCKLDHSEWRELRIENLQAQNNEFVQSVWSDVRVQHADLRTSVFSSCVLDDVVFIESDLSYTQWRRTTLFGAQFFEQASLNHAEFRDCVFVGLDWQAVRDLDMVRFERCQFIDCAVIEMPSDNLYVHRQHKKIGSPPAAAAAAATAAATPIADAPKASRFSSLEMPANDKRST